MSSRKSTHLDFSPGEQRLFRYTIVTLCALTLVGVILFMLWALGQVISALHILVFPLAIAGVLALILFPIVTLFEHRFHMNRLGAVISLCLILVSLLILLIVLVLPKAINQGGQFFESVPEILERGHEALSTQFPTAFPVVEQALADIESESMLPAAEEAADRAMAYLSLVVGIGFVPLYLFFALLSGHRLKDAAKSMLFLFSKQRQNEVMYLGQLFINYVTAFFCGQMTIALIMGIIMAVGFTVVGLEGAIFFGLALGLLNIVPYLGMIVGIIAVLPVAAFQPDGSGQLVLLVLAIIAVTQLIESVLLTPKIMADRSGLHPALVVTSILFWGTVLGGVAGMILAVPLTAFLVTLGKHLKNRLSESSCYSTANQQLFSQTHTPDDRQP